MKLKLLLALFVLQMGYSQQRSCGMETKMQQIMSNPGLREQYLKQQEKFNAKLNSSTENRSTSDVENVTAVIRIPVAVHFPGGNNANRACLVALAQSQIAVLNADFNGTNADISNWAAASSFFPGTGTGNFQVEYVLATQNHPAGTDPNLVNGQPAVTVAYNFGGGGDSDANWDGYLNFVVRNLGGSILGYSPLGGLPMNGDAVVINKFCFGTGAGCPGNFVPEEPFNKGRTVTHELGHFFNLDHTFGDESGCTASNTDFVADTPKLGTPTFGCPANGATPSCVSGQAALTMNYMDYVDDPCMYMFSAGQTQRSLAYLATIQNQFSTNVLGVDETAIKSFSVTPNPNNGNFTIQFASVLPDYAVDVYDIAGRKVFARNVKDNGELTSNIQLPGLSKGLYIVNITANNQTASKKMIVK